MGVIHPAGLKKSFGEEGSRMADGMAQGISFHNVLWNVREK